MSVNDKTENRGTHGVSSSMLDTLVSSSENPLSLDMGSVKGMSEDEKKYVRSVMFESLRGLQDYLLFLKYGGENRSIPVTDVVDGMLEIVRYLDGETQNQ